MSRRVRLLPLLAVLLLVAACGSAPAGGSPGLPSSPSAPASSPSAPASSPSPDASSAPSDSPMPTDSPVATDSPLPTTQDSPIPSPTDSASSGSVDSAAEAAALVLASDPRFAPVVPADPDLIGSCCTYEVTETPDGWRVTVQVGWGDCMAGCIDQHRWVYAVGGDGSLDLVEESGTPVLPDLLPTAPATGEGAIDVRLLAGPTCPAEQLGDPSCAPRPVANAEVVVRDVTGREVGRGVSDADGTVRLTLPAGVYVVEGEAVEGFMGTAAPVAVSVTGDGTASVTLRYDTGIR